MKQEKILSIQVIRAVAFILIFLSHVNLIATGPIGVSLFLVLSGFCMTYSYLDKPEKTPEPSIMHNFKFAWRKVKKLYPLHIVTLLFVALVIFGGLVLQKASRKEIAEQGAYFVANGLLLQSWIPWRDGYFSFNAVSWYLSTSVFSYFVFPWVFQEIRSREKRRLLKLVLATLGLMVFTAAVLGIGQSSYGLTRDIVKWIVYICPLYRAGDFIIGLAAGYVFVSCEKLRKETRYTIAEIAVIALMITQVVLYNKNILQAANWSLTLFWLPTSVFCVYLFAVNKGAVSRALSKSRVLIWIGNNSAEAFLIHQICIKAVQYLTKNKWLVSVFALALTLTGAVVWRWTVQKIQAGHKARREIRRT